MAIRERFISVERFEEIVEAPENYDRNLELVDGVVIEMSKPNRIHGVVSARMIQRVGEYVEVNGLGYVVNSRAGFVLECGANSGTPFVALMPPLSAKRARPNHLRIPGMTPDPTSLSK